MAAKPPAGRSRPTFTDQEALQFPALAVRASWKSSRPSQWQPSDDLSLAYSPGVAVPVLAIAEDESRAYDYTTRAFCRRHH